MVKVTPERALIVKSTVGLFSFALTAGVPMVFIGIALMVTPFNRRDHVDQYNDAVRESNSPTVLGDINEWNYLGSNIDAVKPELVRVPYAIGGDLTDVENTAGGPLVAVSMVSGLINQHRVALNQIDPFTVVAPAVKQLPVMVECDEESCTPSYMVERCKRWFGADSKYDGTGFDIGCERGYCGHCTYPANIREVCVVVRQKADGNFERHPTMSGCYFPFTDAGSYAAIDDTDGPQTFIPFFVRHEKDDMVAIQHITEGTMDFGPNKMTERMAGYGLLVSGIIAVIFSVVLAFKLRSVVVEIEEEEEEEKAKKEKHLGNATPKSNSNEPTAV